MKKILLTALTLIVGLTVLAGYFFKAELSPVLIIIMDWGILLLGVAALIGLGYLIRMHLARLFRHEKGGFYSLIALLGFVFSLAFGLVYSPHHPFFRDLILNVQLPVEASLLAILAVSLLYASLRLIRTRGWTLLSVGFLFGAVLSLILNLAFFQVEENSLLAEAIAFLRGIPMAGGRGILLGMALGGLIVGLRVLFSINRPYGEG